MPFYVLAFTSYPFSYDQYENPSILISNDGLRFYEEQKGMNPLVPPPAFDHNDDPDLLYSQGNWYLVYLETLRPSKQRLILLESENRIDWKKSILSTYDFVNSSGHPFIVSPSLIEDNGKKYLFYVNRSVSPYRIEYYE